VKLLKILRKNLEH